ncbi:Uncharacterized protein M6B38_213360 [Iris pallida]|uniref:Uncharacterized protein n=1 Tax=Iris pallida TaxID=29817 RepID=A0AAX6E245_IRIPA|nr:Uncharacterized protein M6B38_213360 [Iris pallida]
MKTNVKTYVWQNNFRIFFQLNVRHCVPFITVFLLCPCPNLTPSTTDMTPTPCLVHGRRSSTTCGLRSSSSSRCRRAGRRAGSGRRPRRGRRVGSGRRHLHRRWRSSGMLITHPSFHRKLGAGTHPLSAKALGRAPPPPPPPHRNPRSTPL